MIVEIVECERLFWGTEEFGGCVFEDSEDADYLFLTSLILDQAMDAQRIV